MCFHYIFRPPGPIQHCPILHTIECGGGGGSMIERKSVWKTMRKIRGGKREGKPVVREWEDGEETVRGGITKNRQRERAVWMDNEGYITDIVEFIAYNESCNYYNTHHSITISIILHLLNKWNQWIYCMQNLLFWRCEFVLVCVREWIDPRLLKLVALIQSHVLYERSSGLKAPGRRARLGCSPSVADGEQP